MNQKSQFTIPDELNITHELQHNLSVFRIPEFEDFYQIAGDKCTCWKLCDPHTHQYPILYELQGGNYFLHSTYQAYCTVYANDEPKYSMIASYLNLNDLCFGSWCSTHPIIQVKGFKVEDEKEITIQSDINQWPMGGIHCCCCFSICGSCTIHRQFHINPFNEIIIHNQRSKKNAIRNSLPCCQTIDYNQFQIIFPKDIGQDTRYKVIFGLLHYCLINCGETQCNRKDQTML